MVVFDDLPNDVFLLEFSSANWTKEFLASVLLNVSLHAILLEYMRVKAWERCNPVSLLKVGQTNNAL